MRGACLACTQRANAPPKKSVGFTLLSRGRGQNHCGLWRGGLLTSTIEPPEYMHSLVQHSQRQPMQQPRSQKKPRAATGMVLRPQVHP